MATLRMTYAEYLEFEAASDVKHEFIAGEVFVRGELRGAVVSLVDHAAAVLA